jgi:hypothetical protein
MKIGLIQRAVCRHYFLKISDMKSERRMARVARPRQLAMYLARELTDKSLPDIGALFGGRDHTTVLHARARISELLLIDADLAWDYHLISCLLMRLERRKRKVTPLIRLKDQNQIKTAWKVLEIRADRERIRNKRRFERSKETANTRPALAAGYGPERFLEEWDASPRCGNVVHASV